MGQKLIGSINLNNIQKERIIKGDKGSYYNVEIIVNDEENEYGSRGMIVSGLTKEERDKAKETNNWPSFPVIGNIKFVFDNENSGSGQKRQTVEINDDSGEGNPLPF